MTDILEIPLNDLRRDLTLRGCDDSEVEELLEMPLLIIPGPITPGNSDAPTQKLTSQVAFLAKELEHRGITNRVVLQKDIPKLYIEERHAHVDLGTIIVSLTAMQQLGAFANITQILDFLLNLIQLRFSKGRTDELMPNVKFDLQFHDNEKVLSWHIEGPADTIAKMSTPKRISAIASVFKDEPRNE